jgi:hypothetical protein
VIFLCRNMCAVCLPVKYALESSFRYLTYEVLETDIKDFNILIFVIGACGSAVGIGTALQVERSRVRFPMVSLEFSIDIILLATLWPWG